MQEERGQKGSESPPTPASCPVSVSFLFRAWPLFRTFLDCSRFFAFPGLSKKFEGPKSPPKKISDKSRRRK